MTPPDRDFCITDVRFGYTTSAQDVLYIPQLTVPQGEFLSILGASGCGKSTLLRLAAGLLTPTSGRIKPVGLDKSQNAANETGMVFQSPNLVPWRSAKQNVLLPSELGRTPVSVSDDQLKSLFQLVGLKADDTRKRAAELSGGMQMRVSLARALVLQPSMLLMDEPFAALDDLLRMQLEEDVRRIHNERSLTTILVTHNISEAVFMSDRVVVLGGQPSEIRADVAVPLAPTRDRQLRSSSELHRLVDEVTEALHSAEASHE